MHTHVTALSLDNDFPLANVTLLAPLCPSFFFFFLDVDEKMNRKKLIKISNLLHSVEPLPCEVQHCLLYSNNKNQESNSTNQG